jgi:protein-S-isoprenylcysteine O-methyltransferase Ste14
MRILHALGFALTTVLMYLGIPLLGWGLGGLQGYFASGPRLAYAVLVGVLALGVGWQALGAPGGIRGGKGRADQLVGRQRVVRIAVVVLMYLALLLLPLADRRQIGSLGDHLVVRWVGVALFAVGMGLVFWSGVALGKLYSGDVTLQEGHRLVTDGPYRYVRHPRYSGAILIGLGLSLTFDSWLGLVGSAAFIAIILFRIRDEEALMGEAFGSEWEAYCERTPRLIPFLY